MHGQQATELTNATYHYQPPPHPAVVNAHTTCSVLNGAGLRNWAQMDWYYLRPTPAHLALLRVPIPPGYPRSG